MNQTVEKRLDGASVGDWIRNNTNLLLMFALIIVGALTAFIIGPIGVWVGNGLGVGLAWMNTHAPFIFAIIIPLALLVVGVVVWLRRRHK